MSIFEREELTNELVSPSHVHYTWAQPVLTKYILPVCCFAVLLVAGTLTAFASDNFDAKSRLRHANELKLRGDNEKASRIYESLVFELRGSPRLELSEALRNLADIANSAGQYSKAVSLSLESANVCRGLGDRRCEAGSLSDAGAGYLNSGNYSKANSQFEKALALSEQAADAKTSVLVMNNLGNLYYYLGRYSDAYSLYASAAQLVEKSSALDWSEQWRSITDFNMATLYQRLGNDQRAIDIYRKELASRQVLLGKEVAHVLANLGILYRRLGDPEEALYNYRQAEKYYSRDRDTDGELGVLKNTGIVLALDLGRLRDALVTFDKALALAKRVKNQREIMQARLYRGETLYRMHRLSQAGSEFELALALASQLGTVEEQWKAIYSLGKIELHYGRFGLAEEKFRQAIAKIESLRSRLYLNRLKADFLADKRDVYDAMIELLLDRNDVPAALEFMERSRARVFQDRFMGEKPPPVVTVPLIQSKIARDTALVEFWAGPDRVAAVWITREAFGISQKRFSRAEMKQFRQTLSGFADELGDHWQNNFQKIAALVPEHITPFEQPRYSHLLIMPDGFLSEVPFELISDPAGRPLIQEHDITYMPSAVLLLRPALHTGKRLYFPWQSELTAFGDPVSTEPSPLFAFRSAANQGPLPGAAEEIRSIAGMAAGRSHLYLNWADRKGDFLSAVHSGAPLLHVSTHALADMDNPERSRLLFSPDSPRKPNSFLFLKEIYDLDLRGVDLTTLSACDTERGRLVPGEGVQAFSRALLAVGSHSAVTTLWRVPDEPTADFMKQFYYFLLWKHASKAEALRLAKLQFLRSNSELNQPRFWAAFVLSGQGSEPVPRFISWGQLLIPPLALFASLAVLYMLFRYSRTFPKKAASAPGAV